MAIECWGELACPGNCDKSIPDSEFYTTDALGWGFVQAPDPISESGIGFYYACPDHKDEAFS